MPKVSFLHPDYFQMNWDEPRLTQWVVDNTVKKGNIIHYFVLKKHEILEIVNFMQTLKYGMYMVSGLHLEDCVYKKGCKKISIANDPKPNDKSYDVLLATTMSLNT